MTDPPRERQLDLSGLDLHGITATDYDWRGADCRRIRLRGSRLRFILLAGARLDGADLSRADLSHADLSHAYLPAADLRQARLCRTKLAEADLSGACLAHADLSWADLSGAHLEATAREGANFSGSTVATLLAAGVGPSALLGERAAAPRRLVPALHFTAAPATPQAPLHVSRKEAAQVAVALGRDRVWWEDITTQLVYALLYPSETWADWLPRCASRLVLAWALAHRHDLEATAGPLAHFGRVPLVRVLDAVRDEDLLAGVTSNAWRACSRAAERIAARGGQRLPDAPFAPWPGLAQLCWREELASEGRRMHHCVGTWAAWCLAGKGFIYHVGESAPAGSTVAVGRGGRIVEHRAAWDQRPPVEDAALVRAWLAHCAADRAGPPGAEHRS